MTKNILMLAFLFARLYFSALAQTTISLGVGVNHNSTSRPTFHINAAHQVTAKSPLTLKYNGVYGSNLADSQALLDYKLHKFYKVTPFVGAGIACVDTTVTRCHPLIELGFSLPKRQMVYGQWLTPVLNKRNVLTEYRAGYSIHLPLETKKLFTALSIEGQFLSSEAAQTHRVSYTNGVRFSIGIGKKL